jgi:biotin carboxyl carrier protein
VRYLVADGEHISAGHAYAEVEVMKMYMPLITKEPGILHFHAIEVGLGNLSPFYQCP